MTLPTFTDFTGATGPPTQRSCGDAFDAWKNFGGLTVDEAYQRFCENAERYQEDFMFMGDAAFVFCFPVVEKYIREEEPNFKLDIYPNKTPFDGETHILAACIDFHVSEKQPDVRPLYDRIVDLCCFVLESMENVPDSPHRSWQPSEIKQVWTQLLLKTLARKREVAAEQARVKEVVRAARRKNAKKRRRDPPF
jgi:hypothetical protein